MLLDGKHFVLIKKNVSQNSLHACEVLRHNVLFRSMANIFRKKLGRGGRAFFLAVHYTHISLRLFCFFFVLSFSRQKKRFWRDFRALKWGGRLPKKIKQVFVALPPYFFRLGAKICFSALPIPKKEKSESH